MKILVLNCGSSSIKYKLYDMDDNSVLAAGGAERVGLDGAFVKVTLPNGEKREIRHDIPEHTEGVKFIFGLLTDPEIGAIKDLSEIDAVGHRVVDHLLHCLRIRSGIIAVDARQSHAAQAKARKLKILKIVVIHVLPLSYLIMLLLPARNCP